MVMRVFYWIGGSILALVTVLWCAIATVDLALAVGLVGTPGTYKVDKCYVASHSRRHETDNCYGNFTPDGGSADDVDFVTLEDTWHVYPDGAEFRARQGPDSETLQRTGLWGAVGELWQVGACVAILAALGYQAVKLRGASVRREAHRRKPSWRQKTADWMYYTAAVAIAVGLLSLLVASAEPFD